MQLLSADSRPFNLRDIFGCHEQGGEVRMPEYAIAGSYAEFMAWRNEDREVRKNVVYLTLERTLGRTEKGVLYRIGAWKDSPALEAALALEEVGGV